MLVSILILSTGCGAKKKKNSDTKRTTKISSEEINYIIDNQYIICEAMDYGSCPKGITRILTLNRKNAEKSSVCSGFVVGPKTLVTNAHCIPNKKACKNSYFAIYNGPGSYSKNRCAKIIETELDSKDANDRSKARDYTIVELESEYHEGFLNVSPRSLVQYEELSAWVVDHTGLDDPFNPNLLESRITELPCIVQTGLPFASIFLSNCSVVSGNSGSPVLNKNNEVVAIIWGGAQIDENTRTHSLTVRRARGGLGVALATDAFHFYPGVALQSNR